MDDSTKIVFVHGFSDTDVRTLMRAVKAVFQNSDDIAFAMSTANNMNWKVRDLIAEVGEEHRMMKSMNKKDK